MYKFIEVLKYIVRQIPIIHATFIQNIDYNCYPSNILRVCRSHNASCLAHGNNNNETILYVKTYCSGVGCAKVGYWIVIFSTFVKLAVDQYNFIFRFGIHKFLRSIVGSSSVVSHLFGLFYVGSIFRCLVGSLSGLRTTGP